MDLKSVINSIKFFVSERLDEYATKTEVDEKIAATQMTDDESLELVTEIGLVQPVTSAAGEIFTDSTGAVYSI